MFSLIVILISIVLAAALVAAVVYYGGSSVTTASTQSQGAKLINEGSQIRAAALIYSSSSGNTAIDISELTAGKYLTTVPPNWQLTPTGDGAYTTVTGDLACHEINVKYGYQMASDIPSCSSVGHGSPVCCGS